MKQLWVIVFVVLLSAGCNSAPQPTAPDEEAKRQASAAEEERFRQGVERRRQEVMAEARYKCLYELKIKDKSPEYETCLKDTARMILINNMRRLDDHMERQKAEVLSDIARRLGEPRSVTCSSLYGTTRCSW